MPPLSSRERPWTPGTGCPGATPLRSEEQLRGPPTEHIPAPRTGGLPRDRAPSASPSRPLGRPWPWNLGFVRQDINVLIFFVLFCF